MKIPLRAVVVVIALTTGIGGGALAQSEETTGKRNWNAKELSSEIDRLQTVIESLHQQIGTLSDALATIEARLAEAEGRLAPVADCGDRKHGGVFVGKPVECYYGYLIYQCWNGTVRTLGGECEAARE